MPIFCYNGANNMGLGVYRSSRSGFSLVEMAVVIAIIGLIVGGIMGGRSLIRASGIADIGTKMTTYSDAAFKFRMQYGALPGDMTDATSYWGAAHVTPATCKTTSTGDKKTCNGNGDGTLGDVSSSFENFRFWQQLANADLITSQYSGVAGPLTWQDVLPGENAPSTSVKGGAYSVITTPSYSGIVNWWDAPATFRIIVGLDIDHSSGDANQALLTTTEAKSIDDKFDDGMPGLGAIITYKSHSNCNSNTSNANTARYNVSYTQDRACMLYLLGVRHWNKG